MPDPIRIHTDRQTRLLYAADASMYQEIPGGVAFPESLAQIQQLVRRAAGQGTSITARSAGTSLAGQATGSGIIMDVSRHMNAILDLNPDTRTARVQPGVIRDSLNRSADQHGLLFGPDTATTNRCMIGGMIGNNSCGIYSIKYGTTRDHIREIEAVLSDGSRAVFGPLTPEQLEQKKKLDNLEGSIYRGMIDLLKRNKNLIQDAYPHPEIKRRNTGYALDRLCGMHPVATGDDARPFNLAELLCGSEGTLAMTASATLGLVPRDPNRVMVVPHFDSIVDAMKATRIAVDRNPAAVELVDHIILDATRGNIEQRKNRFFLEDEPHCILLIQFDGHDPEQLADRARELRQVLLEEGLATSAPLVESDDRIERVWNLRKAGLGLLMGLGSDERSPSFCEDTAVRVADLPDYVTDFKQLLDRYDTRCVFYAHASVGELHLRPVIDTQHEEGLAKMKAMADEVADLVRSYNGSLSGEHGDGRARAPYIEKVLGSEMMPVLQRVKEIWDPHYMFNPGKIVRPEPIDRHLRFSPDYRKPEVDTQFHWRKEKGFGNALELCNGAGVCRKLADSGGTMCPSYMATKNERDSTRGRANLFRQLFEGADREAFASQELKDALDLCLSCKACKSECPANVDMARMKAEFMQGWHEQRGTTLSERFFGQADSLYPLAALFPRLTNRFLSSPVGKELMYRLFNVDPRRELPEFARRPFMTWFEDHTSPETGEKVVLLVDIFSNYHDPGIPIAATRLLEALGYEVVVPGVIETGRTQISKGLVRHASGLAQKQIDRLSGYTDLGIPVVGLEPSELLTLRDEYPDLCSPDRLERAEQLAANSYLLEEFLVKHARDPIKKMGSGGGRHVYVHGHCHAKALVGMDPLLDLLELAGFRAVDLETGCCGMAGSFGYEKDHYQVSMNIGELTLFPSLKQLDRDALVCAPGFSCRHQIRDGTGQEACHPAELLADLL